MIRVLTWFLGSNMVETFRTNWSVRQGERTDPRALAGDELIAALRKVSR